ncbi:MAG: hypothetical protein CMJ64_05460 [Planctomycetaceae bacterium]|nr:hypothetical protein [Planctomycetaceae bacterium]
MLSTNTCWRGIPLLCVCLAACSNRGQPTAQPTGTAPPAEVLQVSPNVQQATNETAAPATQETVVPERELFEGWAQPKVAFVLSGQQKGYIEPCGCSGLANQKGGLARRHTLIRQLRKRGWPVVALDAGNQVRRFGRQPEAKFQVAVDSLKRIGYQAIAFGDSDLRLSAGVVASATMPSDTEPSPFVCANAAVFDRSATPQYQIVEAGDKKIGVTAILGSEEQKQVVSGEIILQTPEAGLDEVMPTLRAADCDLLVLLAHASIDETKELARKYSDFDLVVTTGGRPEPSYQPEEIDGTKAMLIQTGKKAMYTVVVGVFDDEQQTLRYQRVPLDARFDDSAEMLRQLASYQDHLNRLGLEGLELKPILHASGNKYVGTDECKECHQKAFAVWEGTPHASATDSLVHPNERSEIQRHFDPECLSCHVTGWNPQRFFPYSGGYLGLEATPTMIGNGCENCHGPGSAHVAAESGDIEVSDDKLTELREAMRLPLSKAEENCQQCHDLDNDPKFLKEGAFDKYWPKVEHKGMD